MGSLSNKKKKELAENMIVDQGQTPERVMEQLDIPRTTMYRWLREKKKGELSWAEQRQVLQSAPHKIKQFIDKKLLEAIDTGTYDPKFSDFLIKAVKARETLDKHLTTQVAISVFAEFDKFMAEQDLDKAKDFIKYHKAFIYHKAAQE